MLRSVPHAQPRPASRTQPPPLPPRSGSRTQPPPAFDVDGDAALEAALAGLDLGTGKVELQEPGADTLDAPTGVAHKTPGPERAQSVEIEIDDDFEIEIEIDDD